MGFLEKAKDIAVDRLTKSILGPIDTMVTDNLSEISTTIGSFFIRNIRNKFARSITFTIGLSAYDDWMEDALYSVLYRYNDIEKKSKLELVNSRDPENRNEATTYYRLANGSHSLKYRNYNITLVIQTLGVEVSNRSYKPRRTYTIITYDLNPKFIADFEFDILKHKNAIHKNKISTTVDVFKDGHESLNGETYWEPMCSIPKRKLSTLYLPLDTKNKIINAVNEFFMSKNKYREMGVPHNLKILLYGGHGYGKDTIARVIASEYNRTIYYVTGGTNGKFIPEAIVDLSDNVRRPLFIISDIDKYPFLINEESNVAATEDNATKIKDEYRYQFGKMINALDGIMAPEDRIIIMTTNHIEKFSPVFTRPGRVDLMVEIKSVGPYAFRKFTYDNYNIELPKDIKLKSDTLSIADLQFDTLYLKSTAAEFIDKYVQK